MCVQRCSVALWGCQKVKMESDADPQQNNIIFRIQKGQVKIVISHHYIKKTLAIKEMLESTDHQSWRSKMKKKIKRLRTLELLSLFGGTALKCQTVKQQVFSRLRLPRFHSHFSLPPLLSPALHPSSSNRTSGWEEHRERRECLQEIGSKVAPFQRQLRGSGEDCSQEHVPQSSDTVSRREEEEEEGGGGGGEEGKERQREGGRTWSTCHPLWICYYSFRPGQPELCSAASFMRVCL